MQNDAMSDAVGDVIRAMMKAAMTHQVCPGCLGEMVYDMLGQLRDQLPHIEDGEAFEVREVHIHDTTGNA